MTYYGKIVHVGEKDRKEGARGEREREMDGRKIKVDYQCVSFINSSLTTTQTHVHVRQFQYQYSITRTHKLPSFYGYTAAH